MRYHGRLVVVDKLIRSAAGHYLEYAQRVTRAAEQSRMQTVILGNSRFRGARPGNLKRVVDFNYDRVVLGTDIRKRRARETELRKKERRVRSRARLLVSPIGIASAAFHDLRKGPRLKGVPDKAFLMMALLVAIGIFAGRALALALLLFIWPIRALGRVVARIFGSSLGESLAGWFIARMKRVENELALRDQVGLAKRIVRALVVDGDAVQSQSRSVSAALRRLHLDKSDHILWPTVKEADLDVVQSILETVPESKSAHWHLVFREPIFLVEGRDYVVTQTHRALRTKLQALASLAGLRISFWTDTSELSEQYSFLGVKKFGTLPVAVHEVFGEVAAKRNLDRDGLALGYFGDARPEKGFAELPQLMEKLSRPKRSWIAQLESGAELSSFAESVCPDQAARRFMMLALRNERVQAKRLRKRLDEWKQISELEDAGTPSKITLLAQANFNVPEGVSVTRAAKYRLLAQDNLGVEIFDHPPSSEDYVANFAKCDVAILNYTHPLYWAGSSGVFAEALAAGMSIVASDATWGGRRLRTNEAFISHASELIGRTGVKSLKLDRFQSAIESVAWNPIPKECSHVAATSTFAARNEGDSAKLVLELLLNDGRRLTRSRNFSGAVGRSVAIIELPPGASCYRAMWQRLDSRLLPADLDASLHFLSRGRSENAPISAVGLVISDVAELPSAIREISKHRQHYLETALASSAAWRMEHSTERLIALLEAG